MLRMRSKMLSAGEFGLAHLLIVSCLSCCLLLTTSGCGGGAGTDETGDTSNAADTSADSSDSTSTADGTKESQTAKTPETAEAAAQALADGLSSGEMIAVWNFLPESYQKDVNGLVVQFAGKMDEELWSKGMAIPQKLVKILKDKKEFILEAQMTQSAPVSPEELKQNYDDVVAMLDTLFSSEVSELSQLKSFDGKEFFSGTATKLMQQAIEISENTEADPISNQMMTKFKDTTFETVKEEDGVTTLKITTPEKETEEQFVQVDGKWVMKDMADEWSTEIAKAKQALEQITPEQIQQQKPELMGMMEAINEQLDEIAATETKEEFEAKLGEMAGSVMGMIMMQSAPSGPDGPGGPGFGPEPPSEDAPTEEIEN